jgi:hypothetical protein
VRWLATPGDESVTSRRRSPVLQLLCVALVAAGLAAVPLGAAPAGAALVRPNALSPGAASLGATALGVVPATQNLTVSVALPPSNQAALTALLQGQSDPASPEYHHWLAPGQFNSEFGPSPSDISAVTSWLSGAGLSPTVSGFLVTVTAPESELASALGTSFERYELSDGDTGYVASSAPLVPADLASGQISSIMGLNTTYRFTAQNTLGSPDSVGTSPDAAHPNADGLTACAGASAVAALGYYTLDEEGAAYGIGSLLSAGQNGTGVTIGLFELGQSSASDIATYKSCFGLTNGLSVVSVNGGAASGVGGTTEADLDAEQAMTQSPDAHVISYEGPNDFQGSYDVWNAIVTADAAQVVSTSWGQCELGAAAEGEIPDFTTLFEQASAQGQSVFAAAGDSGSEDCFPQNGTMFEGSTAEEVDYPASDAWVTAVGGTTMLHDSATDQTAWNTCVEDESVMCAGEEGTGAGGSGMSRYEPRPTYQPNILSWPTAQSCGTLCREVPDISANAGVGMVIYENGVWAAFGGTSAASPLMSGLAADTDSACGRIGVMTPLLYGLYSAGSYGSAFADITSGNTDITGSNGGAFPATTGYDAATGIGTPYAAGLACPSVSAVGAGDAGADVTVSGLGLEHAAIDFGSTSATVVSATATSATVTVPAGSGTVTVSASSLAGISTQTARFTYPTPPPPPAPPAPQHGYWLVGSDGGIFTFGSAQFYGSTGSLRLQRPVVGIVPTEDRGGYWLDASDGGIFAFGNAGFYGSIPGLGLHPAGSGLPSSLNAPIVGMVPSADGSGYFMVASDGGVFAFGDARFAGSCPGIGGCSGAAVAVMPDASGNGYWLVTESGHVYTFGDAPYFGAPGPQSVPVTSAVRTPDGQGYWILFANGAIANFGDAGSFGSPAGQMGGLDPATAIFATSSGDGYWIAAANGAVANYGDAPNDGSMLGTQLNGSIIAATGW